MARTTAATALCLVAGMLSLAGAAHAQAPLFEVERSDAIKLLRVTDDAGFLVRGTPEVGTIPATGAGVRLMWYPGKWAFRAGFVEASQWDEGSIGLGSVALGSNTRAIGKNSLALNDRAEARGQNSIAGGFLSMASGAASLAVGQNVEASGRTAVAFGEGTIAGGDYSFAAGKTAKATGRSSAALGLEAVASGESSFAAGVQTKANGNASVAMGYDAVAAGVASVALGSVVTAPNGSFVFGDNNTGDPFTATPNQFSVRAFGGIHFRAAPSVGCVLYANTGGWSCTSSKLVKEAFEDVDGEDLLARLKEVPIQRWRYIGTSARHIGPFAEDFHAAFGLGDSPDKIGQIDADGVALSAVQALERRTAELRVENATLRDEATELRAETTGLRAENAALTAETTELRRRVEALELSGRHPLPR